MEPLSIRVPTPSTATKASASASAASPTSLKQPTTTRATATATATATRSYDKADEQPIDMLKLWHDTYWPLHCGCQCWFVSILQVVCSLFVAGFILFNIGGNSFEINKELNQTIKPFAMLSERTLEVSWGFQGTKCLVLLCLSAMFAIGSCLTTCQGCHTKSRLCGDLVVGQSKNRLIIFLVGYSLHIACLWLVFSFDYRIDFNGPFYLNSYRHFSRYYIHKNCEVDTFTF